MDLRNKFLIYSPITKTDSNSFLADFFLGYINDTIFEVHSKFGERYDMTLVTEYEGKDTLKYGKSSFKEVASPNPPSSEYTVERRRDGVYFTFFSKGQGKFIVKKYPTKKLDTCWVYKQENEKGSYLAIEKSVFIGDTNMKFYNYSVRCLKFLEWPMRISDERFVNEIFLDNRTYLPIATNKYKIENGKMKFISGNILRATLEKSEVKSKEWQSFW